MGPCPCSFVCKSVFVAGPNQYPRLVTRAECCLESLVDYHGTDVNYSPNHHGDHLRIGALVDLEDKVCVQALGALVGFLSESARNALEAGGVIISSLRRMNLVDFMHITTVWRRVTVLCKHLGMGASVCGPPNGEVACMARTPLKR
jgi:hypothetical protein